LKQEVATPINSPLDSNTFLSIHPPNLVQKSACDEENRSSSRKRVKEEENLAKWNCHRCTFINEPHTRKCRTCGTGRKRTAPSPRELDQHNHGSKPSPRSNPLKQDLASPIHTLADSNIFLTDHPPKLVQKSACDEENGPSSRKRVKEEESLTVAEAKALWCCEQLLSASDENELASTN
jgi:ribosomal protein L40E